MDFSLLTKFNLLSKYPSIPIHGWYRKAEAPGEKAVFFTSTLTGWLAEERALPGFYFVSRKGPGQADGTQGAGWGVAGKHGAD